MIRISVEDYTRWFMGERLANGDGEKSFQLAATTHGDDNLLVASPLHLVLIKRI